MTDFVTRLENELHAAALRREGTGVVRGLALPRMRLALGGLPTAALATVLLGLALAGVAILLASSPDRAAHGQLPPGLHGIWQSGRTELRLFVQGSPRCQNLGLGSSQPCYTIGSAKTHVAQEWGGLTVAGHRLTLRSAQGGAPGSYRWRVEGRTLRLAEIRDPITARAQALGSQPLSYARTRHAKRAFPIGWTARGFSSELYGYSIRYPEDWTARGASARGQADRLSPASGGSALPAIGIVAQDLPAGTDGARWDVIVGSRSENDACVLNTYRRRQAAGVEVRITTFPSCGGTSLQTATFVHGGRGYIARWRGKPGRVHVYADARMFDALLRSIAFSR